MNAFFYYPFLPRTSLGKCRKKCFRTQVFEIYGVGGKALDGIRSFYEQSSVCARVIWNVMSCFTACKQQFEAGVMNVSITVQCLNGRSGKMGLRKTHGKRGKMIDREQIEWLLHHFFFLHTVRCMWPSQLNVSGV